MSDETPVENRTRRKVWPAVGVALLLACVGLGLVFTLGLCPDKEDTVLLQAHSATNVQAAKEGPWNYNNKGFRVTVYIGSRQVTFADMKKDDTVDKLTEKVAKAEPSLNEGAILMKHRRQVCALNKKLSECGRPHGGTMFWTAKDARA